MDKEGELREETSKNLNELQERHPNVFQDNRPIKESLSELIGQSGNVSRVAATYCGKTREIHNEYEKPINSKLIALEELNKKKKIKDAEASNPKDEA